MKNRRTLAALALTFLVSVTLPRVRSQGLMGGFKGHHHRGHGAVELLLATGILAKLLNYRARNGGGFAARHMLHSLIGGPRYPPRYARFPVADVPAHPNLLQDELLEPHASVIYPYPDLDLMLHQESALLGAKSPLLLGATANVPLIGDSQLITAAEAQQILAARRARKLLAAREARKLIAAHEARNLLAAQREAHQLLAAQEAQTALLAADQSRQILSSSPPPRPNPRQLVVTSGPNPNSQQLLNILASDSSNSQIPSINSRSDGEEYITLQPQNINDALLLNFRVI